MDSEDVRYDHAAEAAAHIINVCLYADMPKAQVYFQVLQAVLAAVRAAESEASRKNFQPSDN